MKLLKSYWSVKEAERKADPGSSAGKRTAATTASIKSSSGKKTGNKILKKPGKEDSKKRKRITIASDSERFNFLKRNSLFSISWNINDEV